MLAARYLDGSIDALELLLGSEPRSQSALGQHGHDAPQLELQPTSLSTHKGPGASTADAGDSDQAASEQRERRPESMSALHAEVGYKCGPEALDTGIVSAPSKFDGHEPGGGVPRRHASELSYDDFVLQYMGPNLPAMIQVSASSAHGRRWEHTCRQSTHACWARLGSWWTRQHTVLPKETVLCLQGVTDGWPSVRDWVDAQGGVNLEALTKQFGNAKIWATECTRCFASLHLLPHFGGEGLA